MENALLGFPKLTARLILTCACNNPPLVADHHKHAHTQLLILNCAGLSHNVK